MHPLNQDNKIIGKILIYAKDEKRLNAEIHTIIISCKSPKMDGVNLLLRKKRQNTFVTMHRKKNGRALHLPGNA